MKIIKTIVPAIIFLLAVSSATAQRIFYSEPDRDDLRQLKFEVMGKYGNNYLVYKNMRSRHFIAVYDAEMKQTLFLTGQSMLMFFRILNIQW